MAALIPPQKGTDLVTVVAISAIVYTLAKVTHEGLGHGLACVAAGGTLNGVSSSWCDCATEGLSAWAIRGEKAAGTIANLLVALAMIGLQRWLPNASGATRYFLWLTFVVNALMGAGYLMVDPIFGFGDWKAFLEGLDGQLVLRVLLVALGVALTLLTFRRAARTLVPFVGTAAESSVPLARRLCWLPWGLAGGVLLTGAASLNHYGSKYAFTSALATLGGTWLLVWVPSVFGKSKVPSVGPSLVIERSSSYLAAGMAAMAFLLTLFGPGLMFGAIK
jgi:hypothetical protein